MRSCIRISGQWRIKDFSKEGRGVIGVKEGGVLWRRLDPYPEKNIFVPKVISVGAFLRSL